MVTSTLRAVDYCSSLTQKLHQCRRDNELLDCKILVNTADGCTKEFLAHKIIISVSSNILKKLVKNKNSENGLLEVSLHLESSDYVPCLDALIDFMYTGVLETANCKPLILKQLAMSYEVHDAENLLQTYCTETPQPTIQTPVPSTEIMEALRQQQQQLLNTISMNTAAAMARLAGAQEFARPLFADSDSQLCGSMWLPIGNPLLPLFNTFAPNNTVSEGSAKRRQRTNCNDNSSEATPLASVSQLPSTSDLGNDSVRGKREVIVPSNDHEGWCRNKKYIARVPSGYMCTVCHKVYGRYNSVSYHVTIYHRNPPIRCDEEGCQFSTREARYIHFHKFYRHRIPLPESIDLGSRKCTFCRHISKSPAMLEKHISRHLQEWTKAGKEYCCPQCEQQTSSQKEMLDHMMHHTEQDVGFPCEQCSYRGQTEMSLRQHVLFKHSTDTFSRKFTCELCPYACTDSCNLLTHYEKMHPEQQRQFDDETINLSKAVL